MLVYFIFYFSSSVLNELSSATNKMLINTVRGGGDLSIRRLFLQIIATTRPASAAVADVNVTLVASPLLVMNET